MPFEPRDYYLSKVFQYTYTGLLRSGVEFPADPENRLTKIIERIPDEALSILHEIFRIEQFFYWISSRKTSGPRLLDSLELHSFLSHMPSTAKIETSPESKGAQLKALKDESKLTWDTIARETRISVRWLQDIAHDRGQPSDGYSKILSQYFSRILNKEIRF